ncbi:MAG TPA: Holliday junction resolvase RuvX [Enhygromyxa sp.]|nr:Holliday junction resolvase RuvX [Enhygromyxa sp.]
MRALALDVGSRTIGIAVSDVEGSMAHAREVLRRQGHAADAAAVCDRAAELEAEVIVVGLPLELDGSVGHRARLVGRFVDVLQATLAERGLAIAIERWDERFSTAAAERTLLEADVSRAKRKQAIDAVAAQFILQGWLDARARAQTSSKRGAP